MRERERPVIGITPGYLRDLNKLSLNRGYMDGIIEAGGIPLMLPLCPEDIAESILEAVDGIVFSGGADIDARYFGEENLKCGGEIFPERDSFELLLAKLAIARQMPVMGICRGMQVLNVVLGGTLFQDIYAYPFTEYGQFCENSQPTESNSQIVRQSRGNILKHWQQAPEWYPIHEVHIEEGSKLNRIYGTQTLGVNSFHHQAVRAAGSGLAVIARSSDGIIEAIEGTGNGFIVAVQWHPEIMWQRNELHLNIFKNLVTEAEVFSANASPNIPPSAG